MLCSEYKKRVKAAQTAQEKAKKKVLAGMAPHTLHVWQSMTHACQMHRLKHNGSIADT